MIADLMTPSFTQGYHLPYCVIWLGTRSGKPMMLGDSLKGLGIFKKNDPVENSLLDVSVSLEANKPNSAAISFVDTFGFLEMGIHAGVDCYIKMGYATDKLFMPLRGPTAKLLMVGTLQRPTVNFNDDGTIQVMLKVKDKTDKMRYEKKSRDFNMMPRIGIVTMVLAPYLTDLLPPVIKFEGMTEMETKVSQVRMTDLEFLYYLAKKWGCSFDTRVVEAANKLAPFFVDNSSAGDAFIGMADTSIAMFGSAYRMEWRSGLKNVKSFNFSGEASATQGKGGMLQRGEDGEILEVSKPLEHSGDPHDPSNWELDDSKVQAWLKANPEKTMSDFQMIAFATPQAERHELFYKEKSPAMLGTPLSAASAPLGAEPGLGAGGYTCDFELVRGDAFLSANTPVKIGGDVYNMFRSRKLQGGLSASGLGLSLETGSPRETVDDSIFYWRATHVTHIFSNSGFHTMGKLIR